MSDEKSKVELYNACVMALNASKLISSYDKFTSDILLSASKNIESILSKYFPKNINQKNMSDVSPEVKQEVDNYISLIRKELGKDNVEEN